MKQRHFKCPFCKKEIKHIVEIVDMPCATEIFFWNHEAYEGLSVEAEDYIVVKSERYFCPKCKKQIFVSEGEMYAWAEALDLWW